MDKINLKYPASKIDELLIKIDSQNFNNYLLNTGGILKGRYYLGLNAEISNNSGGRILGHDGLSTTIIGNAGGILNLEAVGLNVRVSNGLSSYRVLTEADKGINIVPLDSYGKISSQYLPSSVDDIVEVTSTNDLKTITGERGKIYVTLDTNITYRWSGTQFVEISKSLGLGTNENEAYPGNLGAANATSINNLIATVGTHSSDINTLKSTVGSHTNSLSSITSTLQSVNQSIINQGTTIGEHTQHITDLNNSKLDKTEKAADSAKADEANNSILLDGKYGYQYGRNLLNEEVDIDTMPNGVYGGKLFNASHSLVDFPANADGFGAFLSAAYGKYGIQFIGRHDGYLYARVNDNEVMPWKQIAFTDSTVANAEKLGGVVAANFVQNNGGLWNIKAQAAVGADKTKVLTVNGITSEETYGTTAGIIQNAADNPTGYWWNKFRILHNNSAGYFTELAMPFSAASGLYYRSKNGGEVSDWYKIPYASEIPSLALQGKSGDIFYPEPNALTAGWYRIGVTTRTSQQGWTFRMMLRRNVNYNVGETYIIDVAIGYGGTNNVYFTQVAGGIYNSKFIDKVRVTVASNSVSYIDLHIAADCKNHIAYLFDGDARAYAEGTIISEETATTYEFSTVNGLSSSHNITAPKFSGDIALPYPSGESETSKIMFTGDAEYRGPYIKAVGYGGYGRKKWQLFQHTEAAYPSSYANHTLAIEVDVNGNVGIGTTSPTEKLEVNGNVKANNGNFSGTLTVGGNATITGTMTATATYHSSDERLKTFEGDVEVDLEKLKALPKKYFHWTADADGKRQLGTSAQAVEKLFPELVSTDADGYKSVNYANLSIVALAAVDKLAEQNEKLAEQNTELSKKNAELERRLAKIEKLLNIE